MELKIPYLGTSDVHIGVRFQFKFVCTSEKQALLLFPLL